jgi:hypothetical protein
VSAVLCEGLEQEYRRAQARADAVAQAFGDAAPRWLEGERLTQYRARLLRPYQKYSNAWRDVPLPSFPSDKALDTVESQVFAAALEEARQPTSLTVKPGELVERVVTDDAGRRVRKFYGDPEVCWGPFKTPSRLVTAWNVK